MNILVKLYNQKLCIAPYVIYSFYYYYYIYIYIYIYIYPNFLRNTIVRLFTVPSSEWKPRGQDVSALSAEKEINKI